MSSPNPFRDNMKALIEHLGSSPGPRELAKLAREVFDHLSWQEFSRAQVLELLATLPAHQVYGLASFGKFNCTLVDAETYTVTLSFMDGIPTEIHNHGFYGYFHYLEGSSMETRYEELPGREICPQVFAQAIKVGDRKLIEEGKGEAVQPGTIHQITRLGPRSTVLVVRSKGHFLSRSSLFTPSGHRVDVSEGMELFSRKIQLLKLHPEFSDEVLRSCPTWQMVYYCYNYGANSGSPVIELIERHLGGFIPVEEFQQGFKDLAVYIQRMASLGRHSRGGE